MAVPQAGQVQGMNRWSSAKGKWRPLLSAAGALAMTGVSNAAPIAEKPSAGAARLFLLGSAVDTMTLRAGWNRLPEFNRPAWSGYRHDDRCFARIGSISACMAAMRLN
jgi:hypothetical protein